MLSHWAPESNPTHFGELARRMHDFKRATGGTGRSVESHTFGCPLLQRALGGAHVTGVGRPRRAASPAAVNFMMTVRLLIPRPRSISPVLKSFQIGNTLPPPASAKLTSPRATASSARRCLPGQVDSVRTHPRDAHARSIARPRTSAHRQRHRSTLAHRNNLRSHHGTNCTSQIHQLCSDAPARSTDAKFQPPAQARGSAPAPARISSYAGAASYINERLLDKALEPKIARIPRAVMAFPRATGTVVNIIRGDRLFPSWPFWRPRE